MKTIRLLTVALVALALTTSACKDDKPKEPATQDEPAADEKDDAKKDADDAKKDADAGKKDGGDAKAGAEGEEAGTITVAEEGGKWVASNSFGVKFRVPEDWVVKLEADGISATDSDETTTLVLVGSESHNMVQAAVQDIQKKVKIKDAKIDKSAQTVLNGFPGQNVRGTAVLEKQDGLDQEIQFIAYNVRIDKDTVVTMMIFSEAEMYEAKREIIEGLAKTLVKSS